MKAEREERRWMREETPVEAHDLSPLAVDSSLPRIVSTTVLRTPCSTEDMFPDHQFPFSRSTPAYRSMGWGGHGAHSSDLT